MRHRMSRRRADKARDERAERADNPLRRLTPDEAEQWVADRVRDPGTREVMVAIARGLASLLVDDA